MLLVFIITLQHEGGSAALFKQEFAVRVKACQNIYIFLQNNIDFLCRICFEILRMVWMRHPSLITLGGKLCSIFIPELNSKIRNMIHWYFRFDTGEGPTIPVRTNYRLSNNNWILQIMAYLAGDNRLVHVPRNIKLSQLHKTFEDIYNQWVIIYYLDDAHNKHQVGVWFLSMSFAP